jgi:hypothetical protein
MGSCGPLVEKGGGLAASDSRLGAATAAGTIVIDAVLTALSCMSVLNARAVTVALRVNANGDE